VFNFSGSEIVFLLLLALIVLGPEKLPDAVRKFGKTYAEFKKVSTGFQTELKQALDEPMREMRQTAEMFKEAATFDVVNPADEVKTAAKGVFDPAPTSGPASAAESVRPALDAPVEGELVENAAPPRVSSVAQANASADQPFAKAAAETAAAAEAGDAAEEAGAGEPEQPMRTLDEVMSAKAGTDHEPPAPGEETPTA